MVEILKKLAAGSILTIDEAYALARAILGGAGGGGDGCGFDCFESEGESPGEVAGFVKLAREYGVRVPLRVDAIDTAGTGGDGARTINLSTAAAVVAAAAG